MNVNSVKSSILGFCAFCLLTATSAQAFDLQPFVQQAVPNLVGYLQTNTVNPPGNESRGVTYLGKLLMKRVSNTKPRSLHRAGVICGLDCLAPLMPMAARHRAWCCCTTLT